MAAPGHAPGARRNVMLKPLHSASPARKLVLATRAAENRHAPSEPEARLWCELSSGKLGVCFHRQVVLGNAIADFFAPSLRLVVEVDGVQHRQRRTADARRDRDLRRLGCEVLRIEAQVVMRDLPQAVALVRGAAERLRR
jgi:very-short-patch-repair endonuclease